ncbi:MAG: hypothetical protein LUF92_13510 [Clostridiales bacterium]|nr:hypothetical protein [Clostridiales bacterium]
MEQITFRGPRHSFIWYDSMNQELLRGFDREKTFYGCNQLRRMIAWEVPLSDIPEQWHSYALNGYISDAERKTHYLPEIATAYDRKLESRKEQLLRRTSTDKSFALIQYLMERQWITNDNYDFVLQQARNSANVDATAALLEYKHKFLRTSENLALDLWEL